MTMTVKGFEKVNGVACVVVSIPVDALFNIPALAPILDQLTAPDVPGAPMQDTSAAPVAPVTEKKPRKPRTKKTAAEVAPATTPVSVVKNTYPNRKKAFVNTPSPAAPVIPTKDTSGNTNEAKMSSHCPHCKPEQFATYKQWLTAGYKVKPGLHGVKLMGISEVVENGKAVKKPFFFTKFCSCQVEAVIAKKVG